MRVVVGGCIVANREQVSLRECRFCPEVANDRFITIRPENDSKETRLAIDYLWMAGGSSHKLKAMKSALAYCPDQMQAKNLLPMGSLHRHGLAIPKVYEDDKEFDGQRIAYSKLQDYYKAFREYPGIQTCRLYKHHSNGCYQEHAFFASDVNLWATAEGTPFEEGFFARNPDESYALWPTMSEWEKRNAIIEYITTRYAKIADRVNYVTNLVETALAFLRPTDRAWESNPRIVTGASRMSLTFPVAPMVDKRFLNGYITSIVNATMGTSKSLETEMDVLNSIGGAAGGILVEWLIKSLVAEGYPPTVRLPKLHESFLRKGGNKLDKWDQVAGHASGVPHALVWHLAGQLAQERRVNSRASTVLLRGGFDFSPDESDKFLIEQVMWKSK